MKKSIAARNYWFNYTARRRFEEENRRNQMTMSQKFNHGVKTIGRISMNYLAYLWARLVWLFKFYTKKVWA